MRRVDLAGGEPSPSLEGFLDRYIGPDRQLTLRFA
jgi:hypothetical protein